MGDRAGQALRGRTPAAGLRREQMSPAPALVTPFIRPARTAPSWTASTCPPPGTVAQRTIKDRSPQSTSGARRGDVPRAPRLARSGRAGHWISSMWGWDGSAGQAWSWRLWSPTMSIKVKLPSRAPGTCGAGAGRSSAAIQVTPAPSHSEEAMVRSGISSVPHSGQGRSTGSVGSQRVQPPVFQPGAWQRLVR